MTEIRDLCDSSDIIFLQETWLSDQELPILANIHEDFYGQGISSIDSSGGILQGRPHGGLAILWRKSITARCRIKCTDDNRHDFGIQ